MHVLLIWMLASSHGGTLLLTPLICYRQHITSAVTVMKLQQIEGFCACLAPILPLVMHPLGAGHEETTASILPVIPSWRWCHC